MAIPEVSIPDPTTDKPPRPRRWIPVSVRMFVAMLVLLATGGGLWIGVPAYRQRLAIREIDRFDDNFATSHRGPRWLDLSGTSVTPYLPT